MKVIALKGFAHFTDNSSRIVNEGDEIDLDPRDAARMEDAGIVRIVRASHVVEVATLGTPERATHPRARRTNK